MTTRTIVAIICGVCILADAKVFALSAVAPEDYIEVFSPECERIVLIDVKEVKVKTLKIEKGIETREVTVEAIRIETLRGNDKEHEFKDTGTDRIISDLAEAKKAYSPATGIVAGLANQVHRTSQCKPGHRYLALFFGMSKFFVEVPKDNEDWRKQVRKRYR